MMSIWVSQAAVIEDDHPISVIMIMMISRATPSADIQSRPLIAPLGATDALVA